MNFPGKVGGYWGWRYPRGVLTDALAYRMRELAFLYGRLPEEPAPAAE
jgi:4-alpha-glucanotransferase